MSYSYFNPVIPTESIHILPQSKPFDGVLSSPAHPIDHQPWRGHIEWRPANVEGLNRQFANRDPVELLRWGFAAMGDQLVMATGFGQSGIVLMHLISEIQPGATVFFLQTDLHFNETLNLKRRLAEQLPLNFVEVHSGLSLEEQARRFGPELWRSEADLCCKLRKVDPLSEYLADKKGWITGIRRDQSPSRAQTPKISWDEAHGLLKLAPVADWRGVDVQRYIEENDLPINPLHAQGYASIGCTVCTRKTKPGEHERDGRWSGQSKTECGIHLQPGSRVRRQLS